MIISQTDDFPGENSNTIKFESTREQSVCCYNEPRDKILYLTGPVALSEYSLSGK
jgi:hypothetical protein